MADPDVQGFIRAVENSSAFDAFARVAPEHCLVHVFARGDAQKSPVELGYYDAVADAITVFTLGDDVVASEAQGVFRGENPDAPRKQLDALDIASTTIGLAQARSIIRQRHDREYAAHPIAQEIFILQQREGVPVWSVTLLTHTLQISIVQLDARDGSVRSSEFRNILELRSPE